MGIFEGKNVCLRAIEPVDLDLLYSWENNTDIWWIGNTLKPFSRDVLKKYIETAHLDIFETKQVRFAIHLNGHPGEAIGFIDLYDFDPQHRRAGVGILIGEADNRKKGYASEALVLLCRYAFNVLMLNQLYCSIPTTNSQSISLFQKAGFRKTGQRVEWLKTPDGWVDDYFFQLPAREWASNSE